MAEKSKRKCPCEGGTLVHFIQPMILSMLKKKPCHGYMLIQKIAETDIWRNESPDPSGVYRILKDLEHRGLVTSEVVVEDNSALGKRIFSLTDEGRECCGSWIATLEQYQRDLTEVISMLEA